MATSALVSSFSGLAATPAATFKLTVGGVSWMSVPSPLTAVSFATASGASLSVVVGASSAAGPAPIWPYHGFRNIDDGAAVSLPDTNYLAVQKQLRDDGSRLQLHNNKRQK